MGVAVGIDLGTTNSCVAIVQGEQAKIVESIYGDRIHPSIICFHPTGEVLAGPKAKERLAIDPENTIYSFKRLLGQDINAAEIQKLISHLPYNVTERNGIPVLQTRNKEATLPEVSALMLRYLREMCEETYGVEIKDAIITVPANFTDVQRASTKIAGRIAGFNVLRILNEPTAAALAYGFGGEKEERIAVYDFGGGTFDITIIELLDDIFEVLSTAGDNFLGGDDFDEKIVFEMLSQFKKQYGFSIEDNLVAMQRIRSVAERAKCQLSSIDEVNATLRELVTDKHGKKIDFSFTITRERFEALSESLVERTLATCEEALELAKLTQRDLDNIVLVGGSTRIPLVRRKVEEFFGKIPRAQVNPDEVVAIGAAINAFSLTQEALDANIPAKKHINPKIDPFVSKSPDAPTATGPMETSSGLAQKVRSSKIPSPARSSSTPPPNARRNATIDPFTENKSPLADMDDPFATASRALPVDRPLTSADGFRPSSKPPKALGKIDLSKRTLTEMRAASAADHDSHTDLPALKDAQEEEIADLPGLVVEEEIADLPGLVINVDDENLPVPKLKFDNELDTWGESNSLAENIDLDSDLPIPKQVSRSAVTDPDLPIPVGHDSDTDLPAYKGNAAADRDLPVPLGPNIDDPDLPVPLGTNTGDPDLPAYKGDAAGDRDLPIPMAPPGVPDESIDIESSLSMSRTDSPKAFDQTGSYGDMDENTPLAPPLPEEPFDDISEDVETIDDENFEEISFDSAPIAPSIPPPPADHVSLRTAPMPGAPPSVEAPVLSPNFDEEFGQIDINPSFEPSTKPRSLSDIVQPNAAGPVPPHMPSYHPYHPLDEVVGDDGHEARREKHEAFSVPIRNVSPAVLLDVSPRGLGIATAGGYCDLIIERNAAIPIEQSRHFSTSRDGQTEVYIDVYQGESRRTDDNTRLGRIELRDLRPAPRGDISILVTFEIDTDGLLNVKALNEETKATQSTQIKLTGGLADDQVNALVEKYSGNAK